MADRGSGTSEILVQFHPDSGQVAAVEPLPVPCLGLAFDPGQDTLYCSNKALMRRVGAAGPWQRVGAIGFDQVSGLAFHTATSTLYGLDAWRQVLLSIDSVSALFMIT